MPFPDHRQQSAFKTAREAGRESVFRARMCDCCGAETPKQFRFCSSECSDKALGEAKERQ